MLRNSLFYKNSINKINFMKSKSKVNYFSNSILKYSNNQSQKHVLVGLITIPATIFSISNYSTTCYCDNDIIEMKPIFHEVIMQTKKEKDNLSKSLLQSLQENTQLLANNAMKLAKYTQRLIMYALFGIPLVGLLPMSYTIG